MKYAIEMVDPNVMRIVLERDTWFGWGEPRYDTYEGWGVIWQDMKNMKRPKLSIGNTLFELWLISKDDPKYQLPVPPLTNEQIVEELPVPLDKWIDHVISGQPEFLRKDQQVKIECVGGGTSIRNVDAFDWNILGDYADIKRYQVLSEPSIRTDNLSDADFDKWFEEK